MAFEIEVFINNSIRITTDNGNIYIDPYKMKEEPHDAGFVFITHPHYDHFSPKDIENVCSSETVLVIPESMKLNAKIIEGSIKEIKTMKAGKVAEINGLQIEAVPAYNIMKFFHLKSRGWLGYVINVDGKRIYISGDIDAIKEARSLKCDIAMIPIGGFYTMNARQAAELINGMKPQMAIPTHYGSVIGKPEDAQTFKELVDPDIRVEIKIK